MATNKLDWPADFIRQVFRESSNASIDQLQKLKMLTAVDDQSKLKVSNDVEKIESEKYEAMMRFISDLAKYSPADQKLAEIFGVSVAELTDEFVDEKLKIEREKVDSFLAEHERITGDIKLEATPENIEKQNKWAQDILSTLPKPK